MRQDRGSQVLESRCILVTKLYVVHSFPCYSMTDLPISSLSRQVTYQLSPFTTKDFRFCLFFEFALVLSSHSPVSNTIQLCASDNERRTRALLTFPKYPASGEAKASKPVSSPVIGKQLLRLFGSMAVRCHPQYITMSPQTLSPPSTLRKKKKTGVL